MVILWLAHLRKCHKALGSIPCFTLFYGALRSDSHWTPSGLLVWTLLLECTGTVLGLPRTSKDYSDSTGTPLGLHSDWTGTGSEQLAGVGWGTSFSRIPVESCKDLFLSHHSTCVLYHLHQHYSIFSINISNPSKLVLISYLHDLLMSHHSQKHYVMIVDVCHWCSQTCSLNGTSL